MLASVLRLHSDAGNYALFHISIEICLFQFSLQFLLDRFVSTSCPKLLYQVAGLLFNICFPKELHFKSEENYFSFMTTVLKGT